MTNRLRYILLMAFVMVFVTSTVHSEDNKKIREKAEAVKVAPAPKSTDAASPKKIPFFVQVAAFKVKKYVYEFMDNLRVKGYEAYIFQKLVGDKETWYAVRIGNYEDLGAASQAAYLFEKQEKRQGIIIPMDPLSVISDKEKTPEISKAAQEEEEEAPQETETVVAPIDEDKEEAEEVEFVGQGMEESAGSLFEQAVRGESAGGNGEITGRLGGSDLDLNGYMRAGLWLGRQAEEDDAEAKSGYGEAALKLRARKGDAGDGYAEIRLSDRVVASEEENNLDVREAYINVYSGPFDIRFGHQIIFWGRADSINPTNNLTPYDMRVRSPDEDDRRLANFGVRTYYNFVPFRLEGVWLPTYAESHFPDFSLPLIQMAASDDPGAKLSGGVGAVRLNYETPALDASVSYLYGYATYPGIEFRDVALTPDTMITVGFTPYRHSVIGFDFATTIKDRYGLRGELAYSRPESYEGKEYVPRPDLFYVLGLDREFMRGDVSVIAQYIGRYVFDWREIVAYDLATTGIPSGLSPAQIQQLILDEVELKNRMIQGQQDRVSHTVFLRAEWKLLQETLSLELVGMYNFTTREVMGRPKVSYDIADALNLTVGGEIFHGRDDTLFGTIEEAQNAGYIEIKVSF